MKLTTSLRKKFRVGNKVKKVAPKQTTEEDDTSADNEEE